MSDLRWLFTRSHADTVSLGPSSGFDSPPPPRALTRVELDALERERRDPPPRFTGRWRDRHYYRGREWTGPTNAIGARRSE